MGYIDLFTEFVYKLMDQPVVVKVITVVLLTGFMIHSLITKVFTKFLLVPPYNWVDNVVLLLQLDRLRVKTNSKIGSYRRRLVLGSFQPSLYSTTNKIKGLKIPKIDKENEIDFLRNCKIRKPDDEDRRKIYGILHPYCNSGGGGEKVLWELVNVILRKDSKNIVTIYHGESATPKEILENVERLFHLKLNANRIVFIYLSRRWLIDPKTWPVLTLVGQLFGSVVLAVQLITQLPPDIWVDTVGLPFAYPLIGMSLKIPILTYTHFPVIQSDMLRKLNLKSPYGLVKYAYWFSLLVLYRITGKFVSLALVNSTWTFNHMSNIWRLEEGRMIKCYPICSPDSLLQMSESTSKRDHTIVSLSQFRDEKRQDLIIKEFAKYLSKTKSSKPYNLKFIGSTRSENDLLKVESLKKLVQDLDIEDRVEFVINCDYKDLLNYLVNSEVGINAMWNEHFGIVVVEYMAAGLIPLVHASAGPLMDIVVPWNGKGTAEEYNDETRSGFYFKSEQDPDYQDYYKKIFVDLHESILKIEQLNDIEKQEIRTRGREIVNTKFTDLAFKSITDNCIDYITKLEVFERVDKREKVEQLY